MYSMNLFSKQCQRFSLPSTIIFYILKTPSSYIAFVKLYRSCKYFYMKRKIFFIQNFYRLNDFEYFVNRDGSVIKDALYWFNEGLEICDCIENFPSRQIYRCTIKKFVLTISDLSLKDFSFIVKENTIKKFCLSEYSFIKYPNGRNVGLDVVLQKLPNVEYFIFCNPEIKSNQNQMNNIEKINLWNKLKQFDVDINCASKKMEFMPLLKFIQKNAATKFYSQIVIKGSRKNYESFKTSSDALFKLSNDDYQVEILRQHVPLWLLRWQ